MKLSLTICSPRGEQTHPTHPTHRMVMRLAGLRVRGLDPPESFTLA
jgi:hypothetical protein